MNATAGRPKQALRGFRYIDVNPLLFTPSAHPWMDFYVEDQLHLTPAAYTSLGEYVAPRVREIIQDCWTE